MALKDMAKFKEKIFKILGDLNRMQTIIGDHIDDDIDGEIRYALNPVYNTVYEARKTLMKLTPLI